MISQEACKWSEKFDYLYIFGIILDIIFLLKCKEYHGLSVQKCNDKTTGITNLENIAEFRTLFSQNKEPYKFSHWELSNTIMVHLKL